MRIDGELMEIWPNEVCDNSTLGREETNSNTLLNGGVNRSKKGLGKVEMKS